MIESKLTPDQYAEMIKAEKPHLLQIEQWASEVGYGEIEVKLTVRANTVTKMEQVKLIQTWLKPKT